MGQVFLGFTTSLLLLFTSQTVAAQSRVLVQDLWVNPYVYQYSSTVTGAAKFIYAKGQGQISVYPKSGVPYHFSIPASDILFIQSKLGSFVSDATVIMSCKSGGVLWNRSFVVNGTCRPHAIRVYKNQTAPIPTSASSVINEPSQKAIGTQPQQQFPNKISDQAQKYLRYFHH